MTTVMMIRSLWVALAAVQLLADRALSLLPKETMEQSPLVDGIFRYGFSECVGNERTLFYYTDNVTTCNASSTDAIIAKPPVRGLRCDVVCDKGYYLGANLTGSTPVSACEKCPRGKYSLGGGRLFSKRTNAWTTPLPIDIHSECVTRNLYTNQWQHNCHPWHASPDGTMVMSGANSKILEQFEAGRLFSSLRISATFVRNGTVTFQYRVSAEPPYDGLVVSVDDKTVIKLISRSDGWEEAVIDVRAGAHTITWDFTKDFSGDEGDDRAEIKVIELVGTAFSDTYCHPCGSDMTMNGGSLCAFCHANEYAAPKSDSELDFTCYKCPKDTFSPKGSIGIDACVERRPCTSEDVVEMFSECVEGKRNVTFTWSEPQTCDPNLPGASALPTPKTAQFCESCPTGFVLNNDDNTCEPCPRGERFVEGRRCAKCPAGEVVMNELEFGRGTKDGWSGGWPSIIDQEAAKQAGWKLTRDGIMFEAPTTRRGGARLNGPNRFELPFNVTFAHTGTLEMMYTLENVPTFENDGTRAWLELEVSDGTKDDTTIASDESETDMDDDDDVDDDEEDTTNHQVIHFANGAMNGTHSETLAFNVTSPIAKRFRLIVRTSSPKAERLIRAKLLFLRLLGTQEGAGVKCGKCPVGYQAIHSDEWSGCRICPAGSFANQTTADGVAVCTRCPVNTFSRPGALECEPCGAHTFSLVGAKTCAAPSMLQASTNTTGNVTYDLEQLQSLVWGNATSVGAEGGDDDEDEDEENGGRNAAMLPSSPVLLSQSFKIDEKLTLFGGIFRPLDDKWRKHVQGQIRDDRVGSTSTDETGEPVYIVQLHVMNQLDAGGLFAQNTARYGQVQCSVPAQYKATSGGSTLAIEPFSNGTGLQVVYADGTPCKAGGPRAKTTLTFLCDPRAGTSVPPTEGVFDSEQCHTRIEWRTAYACPVCDASFYSELKSSCSDGKQSISYSNVRPCFGGTQPDTSLTISTCTDVVLDTHALYTAYAAMSVVAFVVLLLLAAIMIIHRKYRNALNDYMYLKGKMPVNEVITKDGTKERTFEFTPKSTSLRDSPGVLSPPPAVDRDAKEEEEEEEDFTVTSV